MCIRTCARTHKFFMTSNIFAKQRTVGISFETKEGKLEDAHYLYFLFISMFEILSQVILNWRLPPYLYLAFNRNWRNWLLAYMRGDKAHENRHHSASKDYTSSIACLTQGARRQKNHRARGDNLTARYCSSLLIDKVYVVLQVTSLQENTDQKYQLTKYCIFSYSSSISPTLSLFLMCISTYSLFAYLRTVLVYHLSFKTVFWWWKKNKQDGGVCERHTH